MMRISSIDLFRAITVFYIILVHGIMAYPTPFKGETWFVINVLVTQGVRFAIPFFSIVAGYFFGKKIRAGENPQTLLSSYTKRLMSLFILWSIIYIILPPNFHLIHNKINWIVSHPLTFILQGSRVHLWFFISMVLSLGIIELFVSRKQGVRLMVVSIILYLLGLLGGSYSFILRDVGIDPHFNTRNGPFFTTLFFSMGWFLSSERFFIRPSLAIALTIIGYGFHMTEVYLLMKYSHVSPMSHEYLIGTILFGLGLVLFLFSKKDIARDSLLSFMGKYTLGVYISQFIFLDLIAPLRFRFQNLFVEMTYPFVVYALAFTATFLGTQNRFLKRFFL
jgi:surface polysaccharide O-acyltransferase-like enzyme